MWYNSPNIKNIIRYKLNVSSKYTISSYNITYTYLWYLI